MRTLELKDIACYLPYDLQVYSEEQESKTDTVIGVFLDTFDFEHWSPLSSRMQLYKPILHPMTDLTKEIVVDGYNDGKSFIPCIEILRIHKGWDNNTKLTLKEKNRNGKMVYYVEHDSIVGYGWEDVNLDVMKMNYKDIELINQWHFDYKGLINEGLAMDVNEISK